MLKDSRLVKFGMPNSTGAIAGLDSSTMSLSSFTSDLTHPLPQQPRLSSSSLALVQAELPQPTNLILDFNGVELKPGKTSTGQDYALPIDIPIIDGEQTVSFLSPFKGFSQPSSTISENERNEQILQVLAGVREDFAKFNVRVIWDDRGVNSPFFDSKSTVVIITDSGPTSTMLEENVAGIAPVPLDDNQERPDVAIAFTKPLLGDSANIATDSRYRLGNLINTISHEAGHTFGLHHPASLDLFREIMIKKLGDASLDLQFTSDKLKRDNDSTYSSEEQLNKNLGGALASPPNDSVANQILANDARVPRLGGAPTQNFVQQIGTVDFIGDRDTFQFQVYKPGIYTIRQSAAPSSLIDPVVTLWDQNGDFKVVGSGTVSTISVRLDEGTYYAIAGSGGDRLASGNLPSGQTGEYILEIGNSPPIAVDDQFAVVENGSVSGNILTNDSDPDGNPIRIAIPGRVAHGTLTLEGDSFTYTPETDFSGTDSFTYLITDGLATSRQATVTFTVTEAPLIDLIGTPKRDVLVGTDGRDRIIGLQSGDILTGGKGRDLFVFQNINEGGDRITDFTPGKDKIDLSGLLRSISYKGSNPVEDSIISFSQTSNKLSVIQVDPDGSKLPGFRVVPFILLDNVTVADLSNPDNFIFV